MTHNTSSEDNLSLYSFNGHFSEVDQSYNGHDYYYSQQDYTNIGSSYYNFVIQIRESVVYQNPYLAEPQLQDNYSETSIDTHHWEVDINQADHTVINIPVGKIAALVTPIAAYTYTRAKGKPNDEAIVTAITALGVLKTYKDFDFIPDRVEIPMKKSTWSFLINDQEGDQTSDSYNNLNYGFENITEKNSDLYSIDQVEDDPSSSINDDESYSSFSHDYHYNTSSYNDDYGISINETNYISDDYDDCNVESSYDGYSGEIT